MNRALKLTLTAAATAGVWWLGFTGGAETQRRIMRGSGQMPVGPTGITHPLRLQGRSGSLSRPTDSGSRTSRQPLQVVII